MINITNQNLSGLRLLLEMALQTKRRVALVEQSLVNGAMRRMTNYTTLAQSFVLINKRTALCRMAFETSLVLGEESKAPSFERLLYVGATAFDRISLMRVMTIRAAYFALEDRVVVGQLKLRTHFQMALETGLRRLAGIDNRMSAATALGMQASRPMARFASNVLGVRSFSPQT